MTLIGLLIVCLIIAVIFWVLRQIPIPPPFGWIVYAIIGLIIVLYLLSMLGVGSGLNLGIHSRC